jgi:hypothetical protein
LQIASTNSRSVEWLNLRYSKEKLRLMQYRLCGSGREDAPAHEGISLTTLFRGKGSSMTMKEKVVWAVTIALGIVGSAALIINETLKQTAGYTR